MKTYSYHTLTETDLERLLKRPKMDFEAVFDQVRPILKEVQTQGNSAVKAHTLKFDKVELDEVTVTPSEIDVKLPADVQHAIDQAFDNLYRFHQAQHAEDLEVETMEGVACRRIARPIQRVGIYIPGGTAPLPSTAMMLGVPAMIAGCETIVLATPPDKNGRIPDSILYIAKKTGVKTILKAGGAQAIAAMAYGTESVPKVDKIFGPGNQYVTAAKMLLRNSEAMISIDMPAGPSEVLVIADESADPEFVAADLLSQAEHGADSQVVLVAAGSVNLSEIEKEIEKQTALLPRKKITQDALRNSFILITDTTEEAMKFSNLYAPEHLILNTADADTLSESVINAGSVFIGPNTPESMGDYASGTNHTLPTYGYAKMYSGVSLQSFQKYITMQKISEKGLKNLGPTVETLAELEGLEAHKNAVSVRLRKLK